MKKRLICLPLCVVLLLSAGCAGFSEPAVRDGEDDRAAVYDSFSQPELTLEDNVFDSAAALCAVSFDGVMGDRVTNLMNRWMYTAYYSNPGMLEQFRQRESEKSLALVPWYGEFPGKYLRSIALMYRLNHDENLKKVGDELTLTLSQVQGEDGYLGVFSQEKRMLGQASFDLNGYDYHTYNWDMWNHYHVIRGLLAWYGQTGNQTAFTTAQKAADFIIGYFGTDHSLLDVEEADKNLSIVSIYVKLYELTKERRYIDFANDILAAWQGANGGDFYRDGLNGVPYTGLSQRRWETMHALLGMADIYELTGDESFRTAFLNLYESIRCYDRHISGGVMTNEQAVGSVYRDGSVETCAAVAWLECTVKALELTDDPTYADELELTTLNAVLGAEHPSGRSFTYSTPDEGVRLASSTELSFQAAAGSPELNCCSVSGPSGLALLSQWAVTGQEESLTVNYYGAGTYAVNTPDGKPMLMTQETVYPADGAVRLTLTMEESEAFTLRLRIPAWAEGTAVRVGADSYPCQAGGYCQISRTWQNGDAITVTLAMNIHFWAGREARTGDVAIYYGPVLLTYDERFNHNLLKENLTAASLSGLKLIPVENTNVPAAPEPIVLFRAEFGDGTSRILCDFATAGQAGTDYTAWLPVADAQALSQEAPGSYWLSVQEGA